MPSETTIHVAIELSVSSWLVAIRPPGAEKSRLHHIEGGDTTALLALIAELRTRASTKLGKPAEVVCCFEAGRDGFWLHRALTMHGVAAYVLEPTSILVNRRARRAKTAAARSGCAGSLGGAALASFRRRSMPRAKSRWHRAAPVRWHRSCRF
jgi:transposase